MTDEINNRRLPWKWFFALLVALVAITSFTLVQWSKSRYSEARMAVFQDRVEERQNAEGWNVIENIKNDDQPRMSIEIPPNRSEGLKYIGLYNKLVYPPKVVYIILTMFGLIFFIIAGGGGLCCL